MSAKKRTEGWDCDFCPRKAADTVYFHGPKYACEACHARLVKAERERPQNKTGK
jgi:hypothetical protein